MLKSEMHFSNFRAQRPLWGVGVEGGSKDSLCGYLFFFSPLLFHLLQQLKILVTQQLLGIEFLPKSVG